jgi:hypothetical protein
MKPLRCIRALALLLAGLHAAPVARAQAGPSADEPRAAAHASAARSSDLAAMPAPALRWLPWTLLGLGTLATASTLVAFAQRERYATRWNSAECVAPGQTRGSVCPDELDAIQTWDRVMWVSGVSAVVFWGGAILSRSLASRAADQSASTECGVGLALVACRGRF